MGEGRDGGDTPGFNFHSHARREEIITENCLDEVPDLKYRI
jgi:hypothetical protein